jgi:hypothetical protein
MREIKFRAWNKKNKQMVDSDCFDYFWIMNPRPELFEIMQFTGVKDKNGKEIYEGDIIEQTFYGDDASKMILVVEDIRQLDNIRCGSSKENEIIGNIYENPELIKKEAEDNGRIN